MEIVIIWIILSIGIAMFGSTRTIGATGAFFLSLILSPIIGLLITLFSKSLDTVEHEKKVLENHEQQTKALKEMQKGSVADELLKLKGLLDQGVLTQAEFDEQKAKLLAQSPELEKKITLEAPTKPTGPPDTNWNLSR